MHFSWEFSIQFSTELLSLFFLRFSSNITFTIKEHLNIMDIDNENHDVDFTIDGVYKGCPKINARFELNNPISLQLPFYNQTMNVTISVAKTAPYLEITTLKRSKVLKIKIHTSKTKRKEKNFIRTRISIYRVSQN